MKKFINEKTVRERLGGISSSTLRRWERKGYAPSRRRLATGGNRVCWIETEIDEFIASRIKVFNLEVSQTVASGRKA